MTGEGGTQTGALSDRGAKFFLYSLKKGGPTSRDPGRRGSEMGVVVRCLL